MTMDDRDLAKMLDDHLYDHRARNRDCVVCAVILAHHAEWRYHQDVVFAPLASDDPLAKYDVRVDERGWMVIRHQGCDRRVAEWPDAQGMWPLTYEHLMEEARIHQEREHDP